MADVIPFALPSRPTTRGRPHPRGRRIHPRETAALNPAVAAVRAGAAAEPTAEMLRAVALAVGAFFAAHAKALTAADSMGGES